jgi:hypothetical protein
MIARELIHNLHFQKLTPERYDAIECVLYALCRHGLTEFINAVIFDAELTLLEAACTYNEQVAHMVLRLPTEIGVRVQLLDHHARPALLIAVEHSVAHADLVEALCDRTSEKSFATSANVEVGDRVVQDATLMHVIAAYTITSWTAQQCAKVRVLLSYARMEGGGLDIAARCGDGKTAADMMVHQLNNLKANTTIPKFWSSLCDDISVLTAQTVSYRESFPALLRCGLPSDFPTVLCQLVLNYAVVL